MKLLFTAFLFMLSIVAARAQAATANPNPQATGPVGGYYLIFPQVPNTTVHFDANSGDIAKAIAKAPAALGYNHDGGAFKSFVRITPSESYNDNAVDHTQYYKNIKAGIWTKFANGE